MIQLALFSTETYSCDVNFTDQLNFDEVLGRGAVDDGHDGVRLGRPKSDRHVIDVRIRSLGVAESERDQSAELSKRVCNAVCLADAQNTTLHHQ